MSDTLHEAEKKFLERLEQHKKRLEEDPEYRKWWDSLPNRVVRPRFPIGA